MARHSTFFETIRSEGGLLPADLLRRIIDPKGNLSGVSPEDYGLPKVERLNEVVTQSWNRLRKHWTEFRVASSSMPEGEMGTGITNDKWNLPLLRELGFGLLPKSLSPTIEGRTYAINRFFGPVPVHLIGCRLSLDRRAAGVRGAAAANPHGLVQEFLNRSPRHMWAIVSNGLRFRILRDNQALSRQSFLEFDLEAMFTGEVYSDFVLFWLVAHATRFAPRESDQSDTCWLEQWTKIAADQGARALGDLRGGVERALQIFGEGFVGHPKNSSLREALRSGQVSLEDFHGQLLRVVYRLIFLFVAEDRFIEGKPLLHILDDSEAARLARARYDSHYSTTRLREMASKIKGSRHGDLWQQFQLIVKALSGNPSAAAIRDYLALPSLGSFLWNPASTSALNNTELTNHDFLEALRFLAFTRQAKVLRPVDYKNLGAEELGGVYESLLALTPQISADGAHFTFAEFGGNKRKVSGSYYTPDSLVQCLLDTALEPVVAEAVKGKAGSEAEKSILELKVCDPAVGSGHFLVGAAHRLARHLARVRALAQGESEPSPPLYQHALRDIIGHCLYGVDINPMSAELCRVSLWLEALEPGKPLSFLDHHIRVGNSLLGVTPELNTAGLPDDAFLPIEGDDKKICAALKKRNKQERKGQQDMMQLMISERPADYNSIAALAHDLDQESDETISEVEHKSEHFHNLIESNEYKQKKLLTDAWCAAFVWRKTPNNSIEPLSIDKLRRLSINPETLGKEQQQEIKRLAHQYGFFHWHLAFPEVFAKGGFDCVLGNPPWERIKLQEKEWFAERSPQIANAANAAERKRLINALKTEDPELYNRFAEDSRKAEGENHLLRNSGRYPLCGRGDINLYAVFAEAMRNLLSPTGRIGCVLPTGIATDDTTKYYFQDVVNKKSLVSLYDFENKDTFPSVHSSYKFCLFTSGRGLRSTTDSIEFVFFAHSIEDLNMPDRRFSLTKDDIALLNPNTQTCPIFRSRHDTELTRAIYRRIPVLIREAQDGCPEENHWGIKFSRMFDMANDSSIFRTKKQLESEGCQLEKNIFRTKHEEYLPLYEPKLIHQYDHRYATFEGLDQESLTNGNAAETESVAKTDPNFVSIPRYWVSKNEIDKACADIDQQWFLGVRGVTATTNERTLICAPIPRYAAQHNLWLLNFSISRDMAIILAGIFNSFVCDYFTRLKMASYMSQFVIKQLPVPTPALINSFNSWRTETTLADWLRMRIVELTYTANDLEQYARDIDYHQNTLLWDDNRRFLLRCELNAAFFHLYLPTNENGHWLSVSGDTTEDMSRLQTSFATPRDAVAYIMDTFSIVKRRDEEKYGSYRTKQTILDIYDAMTETIRTRQPYQSRLNPPPADPQCCHPERKS